MLSPAPHELQDIVRDLYRHGLPWMPSGLGTRLRWGEGSEANDTPVLSCRKLNQIHEHCVGDFTVRVDAGTPLLDLQHALAEHQQWLALDWPWGSGPKGVGSGTIGGLVARGLAGGLRQRHLGVRDQVIGIELMRSDGTQARAGGRVVKNVAGYDLMRLFTGSWGTLGLITAVTLRTMPTPRHRCGVLLSGRLAELHELARLCLSSDLAPERVDLWSHALHRSTCESAQDSALLVALANLNNEAIEQAAVGICTAAEQRNLYWRRLDQLTLGMLEELGNGSETQAHPSKSHQPKTWLLRLGVLPNHAAELIHTCEAMQLKSCLEVGSGMGMAWAEAQSLQAYRVIRLRQFCRKRGGFLFVLQQPDPSAVPAWDLNPAREQILAIKRTFDPRQQLARNHLVGT